VAFTFDATSEPILTPLLTTKGKHGPDRELQQIELLKSFVVKSGVKIGSDVASKEKHSKLSPTKTK
jgi:hypothetical protein